MRRAKVGGKCKLLRKFIIFIKYKMFVTSFPSVSARRRRKIPWIVLLPLVFLPFLLEVQAFGAHEMSPRIVFTQQGPVQGYLGPENTGIFHFPSGGEGLRQYTGRPIVEVFKGIPYASPPVGPLLRYESPAPLPHRSRPEVFLANVSRPSCPRTAEEVLNRTSSPDMYRALRKTLENSVEDCLYLDIYAPLTSIYYNTGDKSRGNGLAVLVYMNSHPDDPTNPWDGSSVAALGNIIVISVRYRAGVLGFLQPSYSEDVRANFGLWDQLAALQWIKENIEQFGGDSNNISLMGFDVDATLAGLLALSPVSQAYNGLFHRLILINGSPFAPNAINPEPIRTTYQLARALPCPTEERGGDLARCLRTMPVPRLVTAAERNIGTTLLTYPFSPIADGIIVPHDVSQPLPSSNPTVQEMLRKYDLLVGLKEGPALPLLGRSTFANADLDKFITAAIRLTMKLEQGVEPTPELKRAVKNALLHDHGYGPSPSMRELISDFLMVQPIVDLLNAHSKLGRNTYFYVLKDYDPLKLNKFDEISYIFSSNVYKWKYLGSPSHAYKLQPFVMMINLLANFVRNGDPNIADPNDRYHPQVQSWPQYSELTGRYLEIADDVQFPAGYRRLSTDFWGKTFLSIMQSFANKSFTESGSGFPEFPPRFPNRNEYPYDHTTGTDIITGSQPDGSAPVLLGGQSTVVLIGGMLLLLNFLCFLGLFYQKERLKKAEIQLRKRYLEAQKVHQEEQRVSRIQEQDIESASFVIGDTNPPRMPLPPQNQNHTGTGILAPRPVHNMQLRDNMSETETENGFGPEFGGPNYDPRTKVNRWMLMQQRQRVMEDYPPPQQISRYSNSRYGEVPFNPYGIGIGMHPSPENPYEVAGGPYPQQQSPLYQMINPAPSPHIFGLDQLPRHSYQHQNHPQDHELVKNPETGKSNSLQRQSKTLPNDNPQPPKAQPEPPVQFIPQLPYREPFKPSLGSDIPYADSRATSPSIISAPAGFSSAKTNSKGKGEVPIATTPTSSSSTPTKGPGTGTTSPFPKLEVVKEKETEPRPKGILVSPNSTLKRNSTLIVRDLDPQEVDSEPKYVAVKTGTLTRTVAVDTGHDHDTSPVEAVTEGLTNNASSGVLSLPGRAAAGNSQVRVTFKENL